MRQTFIGLVLVGGLMFGGCTRSLEVSYVGDIARLSHPALQRYSLGIGKLDDKRPWVDPADAKSESYIALAGPWKFGVTYKETDYVPVKDMLQDLLLQEFTSAGFNAKPLDRVLSKGNLDSVKSLPQSQSTDYVLGGQLLAFEFVNEQGVFTITSRRTITLNLNVFRGGDGQLLVDDTLTETDREGEGMGILHSTDRKSVV